MGERGQKDLFNGADIVLIRCCYKNPNQSGSLRSEIKRDITDLMKTLCWLIIRGVMLRFALCCNVKAMYKVYIFIYTVKINRPMLYI